MSFMRNFIKSQWSTVSGSLEVMVSKGFDDRFVEPFLNRTLIMLIPKVVRPKLISQLLPINLCTVSYKVLTKVIVTRIKSIMPKLVAKN